MNWTLVCRAVPVVALLGAAACSASDDAALSSDVEALRRRHRDAGATVPSSDAGTTTTSPGATGASGADAGAPSGADPGPTASSSVVPFFGVNGHYVQGGVYSTNIPAQVADMLAMGVTSIRQDCYSTSDTAKMAALVSSFAPIKIQPAFNVFPTSTDETSTYDQFYGYGQTVAGQLAGKVAVIELMNEPENMYFAHPPTYGGQDVTEWSDSNGQWASFRGAVRGFYDGFRAVDTTKQTLIASPSVGWLHYGMLNGLWTGESADGSTGHPTATWDVTNYHWYYDFGDIENAGGVNTLAVIKSAFNRPILLTEIGVQFNVPDSTYNAYVASTVAQYVSRASTYGIIGFDWYELYNFQNIDGFFMGLYSASGVDNAGRASAMGRAIAANPAP